MKILAVISMSLVTACVVSPDPPAVRAANAANASDASTPAPGMGRIVFVRPDSPCDSSIFPIVVDENGHFLAELSQNSRLAVDLPPGEHVLYVFPSVNTNIDPNNPDDSGITMGIARIVAGRTSYVEVFIPRRPSQVCWQITVFDLLALKKNDEELATWLEETTPISVDRAAGEAALIPAEVHAHMEAARRGAARTRESRREQKALAKDPQVTDSADTK